MVKRKYDVTVPVIVDLADSELATCNEDWPTLTTTWTDNCDEGGSITGVPATEPKTEGCYQYLTYTFDVKDSCGNQAVQQSTVVKRKYDVTVPVIVDLADSELATCNEDWPTLTTTWTDNCDEGGSITGVPATEPKTEGCYQYLTYTFDVKDSCGNQAVQQSTVVKRKYDVTVPVIVDLADSELATCNEDWPTLTTTWTDNCDEGGSITGVPATEPKTEGCYQYLTYTFDVKDSCGNQAVQQSTVVKRKYDVTVPVIVDLADSELATCNEDWPTLTTTWTDNCDEGGSITGVPATEPKTEGCYQYLTQHLRCKGQLRESGCTTIHGGKTEI